MLIFKKMILHYYEKDVENIVQYFICVFVKKKNILYVCISGTVCLVKQINGA